MRSWSKRSSKLFLDKLDDSAALAAGSNVFDDKDSNSGNWMATYMKEYADLFQKEIACDVSFRVVDHGNNTTSCSASLPKDVISAHRCILAAQCPKLLYPNEDGARRANRLDPKCEGEAVEVAEVGNIADFCRAVTGKTHRLSAEYAKKKLNSAFFLSLGF